MNNSLVADKKEEKLDVEFRVLIEDAIIGRGEKGRKTDYFVRKTCEFFLEYDGLEETVKIKKNYVKVLLSCLVLVMYGWLLSKTVF
jgi:hypothetical protein